uniref:Glycosyltransferase family 92 protein n=1 Tax=Cyclopterus lumpus TaxID=8103 RepID=A0A8C2ZQ49_CYCLU
AVTGTKTLLVSAYLEHRTGKREVSEESQAPAQVLLPGVLTGCVRQIHTDHFGFAYGTADIMCPLPSSCETPSHIAVTSAAFNSEDTLHKEFLEVKNQKAQSDSFSFNFTVCLSTMFDFTNVLQVTLRYIAAELKPFYCSHVFTDVSFLGLVEVIPWSLSRFLKVSRGWLPSHGPGDLHYFGQIPALNDCVYRHMYQSRYVALHDMDELILTQSLMPLLEKKYGADKCYLFENNVFPNTVTPPPTSQTLLLQSCCSSWQNVSGVNILAHLYQEPSAKRHYENIKTIVNPRAVFTATVHGLLSSLKGCTMVDRKMARMYHTRAAVQTELTPDQLIYDGRLLNYSAQLIPNVDTVLRESGLLPEDNIQ